MLEVEIQLLGRTAVSHDGVEAQRPGGAKAWALLAYVAGSARPCSRAELAGLLFGSAVDPLGALRWNLAALRRLLGTREALTGDPIHLDPDILVDSRLVVAGDQRVLALPGLGQELLAGLHFPDAPAFEVWLLTERRRLAGAAAALLHREASQRLAGGDPAGAIEFAARLVMLDPLNEGHQALLIRSEMLAGDVAGARHHLALCTAVLRSELGVEPGPAIQSAARRPESAPAGSTPASVLAAFEVGWAAFLGGALDFGLDTIRRASAMALATGDTATRALTQATLSAMLGMAVRGWDESVAAASDAIDIATRAELPDMIAEAHGVLAGTEFMQANYSATREHCLTALAMSESPASRATALTFLGATSADLGETEGALAQLRQALDCAEVAGDPLRIYYAAAHLSRVLIHRQEWSLAVETLTIAETRSTDKPMLMAWPQVMRSEVLLAEGDTEGAGTAAGQARALAEVLDLDWARALALAACARIADARGDNTEARELLAYALAGSRDSGRHGYTYHWPVAVILDTTCVVVANDPEESDRVARDLLAHASRAGMVEYTYRALRHLARAGDASSADLAATLRPSLDNPALLDEAVTSSSMPG